MNEEQVQQFLTVAGALAEACSVFYSACLDQDFDEHQALKLTIAFLESTVGGAKR